MTPGELDELDPAISDALAGEPKAAGRSVGEGSSRLAVAVWRTILIVAIVSAWQWLPDIGFVRHHTFLNTFYISSPWLVAQRLVDLATGRGNVSSVWPYLEYTFANALIGIAIAVAVGTVAGLLLSSYATCERVLRPVIVVINSVPRIAIVPVMVLIAGTSRGASIATSVMVVVFLVFFNALEAGRNTSEAMLNFARVSGAPKRDLMLRVRLPYVLGWVAASLPNAIAFGLIGAVTLEVFVGGNGIGQLLTVALNTADSTLTFSVVVILGAIGAALVMGAGYICRRLMPWWY